MSTFLTTLNPTPFGFFDADTAFQSEADSMVTFVKRKLGDDVLSVELTKKQIWACFEESFSRVAKIESNVCGFVNAAMLSFDGAFCAVVPLTCALVIGFEGEDCEPKIPFIVVGKKTIYFFKLTDCHRRHIILQGL